MQRSRDWRPLVSDFESKRDACERLEFTAGMTPAEVIRARMEHLSPKGFDMTIRDPWEWRALAAAWNQGIDSHLEAITTRSTADEETGEVVVHAEELHVLCRRLWELFEADEEGTDEERERCETVGSAAGCLRLGILETLAIEEV